MINLSKSVEIAIFNLGREGRRVERGRGEGEESWEHWEGRCKKRDGKVTEVIEMIVKQRVVYYTKLFAGDRYA